MGCVNSRKDAVKAEMTKKFDSFDFRVNSNDVFTFKMRANRELSGGYAPEDFTQKLFKAYREFMIETATEIELCKKNSPNKKNFTAKKNPPPFVDEMWTLAILYSKKYQELCERLVGGTIDREFKNQFENMQICRKVWPKYDPEFWLIDSSYTVWIYNREIDSLLKDLYIQIKNSARNNVLVIRRENLENSVKQIHGYLSTIYGNVDTNRGDCAIPESHPHLNPEKKEDPEAIYEEIMKRLPSNLKDLMKKRFCVGEKCENFIQEYARFMTMIYFSKFALTPSEEVDLVWHTHQSMTAEYRCFCMDTYNRFIYHTPTVGGQSENNKFTDFYTNSLNFYHFLFKKCPPLGLWPPVCCRMNPRNIVGSWYSIPRIFMCILMAIQLFGNEIPENIPREVMQRYFAWDGKNLFKPSEFIIKFS